MVTSLALQRVLFASGSADLLTTTITASADIANKPITIKLTKIRNAIIFQLKQKA